MPPCSMSRKRTPGLLVLLPQRSFELRLLSVPSSAAEFQCCHCVVYLCRVVERKAGGALDIVIATVIELVIGADKNL